MYFQPEKGIKKPLNGTFFVKKYQILKKVKKVKKKY